MCEHESLGHELNDAVASIPSKRYIEETLAIHALILKEIVIKYSEM